MTTLKQLQEEARHKWIDNPENQSSSGVLDEIVTTAYIAGLERAKEVVIKGKKYPCEHRDSDMCDGECMHQDDYEVAFAREVNNGTRDKVVDALTTEITSIKEGK
jgi:hypothetical protein